MIEQQTPGAGPLHRSRSQRPGPTTGPLRRAACVCAPLALLATSLASGCHTTSPTPLDTLTVDGGPAELNPGETATFSATLRSRARTALKAAPPENVTADATWTSSNPGVLAVERGTARALAPGTTSVTARFGAVVSGPTTVRVLSVPRSVVLAAGPASVPPSGFVTVTWTAQGTLSPLDWIGLFRASASNFDYLEYWYVGTHSGTISVPMPVQPGSYEFRYLIDDGFEDIARSNLVTVGAAGGP